jgi:multicomponent Na+:H+ antiporter subunit G
MDAFASILMIVGALFALVGAWGQLRFRDVFVRIHLATKPATLGLALVLTGALLQTDGVAPMAKLALAIALQFATAPIAGHLVGRAAHVAGEAEELDLVVDDLAEARARQTAEPEP